MIVLDLVLKAYWYDLIKSGEKKCEYREIKEYWTRRLFSRPYTHVRFRKGYTSESILFELAGIENTGVHNDLGLPKAYKIILGTRIQ
ncbi:MAG: hypothetical protein K1W05_08050 [Desulfovibrio sp.]|jgi:hypothetical protein